MGNSIGKLHKAKQVFALSATLGSRIGKQKLKQAVGECEILDTGDQMKNTGKVQLDIIRTKDSKRVFGKGLLGKALELVEDKLKAEVPVILYLKDIGECQKFEKKLPGKCFVFDATNQNQEANLGFLDQIRKPGFVGNPGNQVILTTKAASLGVNFYKKAYVIMTEKPTTWAEYQQIVGRSNRIDYTGEKKAALVMGDKYVTQGALEQVLRSDELNKN